MRRRKTSNCGWLLLLIPVLAEGQPVQETTLRDQVVASQRAELDGLRAGNIAAFTDLNADEAVFVNAAGPAPKSRVVKNMAEFRLSASFRSRQALSLIVYQAAETGTSHGKNFSANVLISATWAQRNSRCVCSARDGAEIASGAS
jgi:hypothetical protein